MLSNTIWAVSIALELLLFVRGWQCGLLRRYPLFFGYLGFVLAQDPFRILARAWSEKAYFYTFWTTEFLGLLVGCVVVFEIYRMALAEYPGAARISREALLLIFALAVAKALASVRYNEQLWQQARKAATALGRVQTWAHATALSSERALRTVQGFALIALILLFLFYAIPFGRNLRGILLGYTFFVGGRIVSLNFVGPRGHGFWFYTYSCLYLVVLSIWLAHMWSPSTVPHPARNARLERDYELIADLTQRRLQQTRGYLRKAVGSS